MERNTRSAERMPVSVFSCFVASVGKLSLSATTLERPGSSAFDELEISCDHENDMLKGAEECSFRDARVDDEMGRSAERERFPALVVKREKEIKRKTRSEQSPITTGMANGQQAIESAPRGKQKRMDGPWGSERVAGEKRKHAMQKRRRRLILCPAQPFPAFSWRQIAAFTVDGSRERGANQGSVGITSFGLYRAFELGIVEPATVSSPLFFSCSLGEQLQGRDSLLEFCLQYYVSLLLLPLQVPNYCTLHGASARARWAEPRIESIPLARPQTDSQSSGHFKP
ncbi:hypothetical protein J3E69DRAFT_204786 [Trichoderma sp. SZMC 28015]